MGEAGKNGLKVEDIAKSLAVKRLCESIDGVFCGEGETDKKVSVFS